MLQQTSPTFSKKYWTAQEETHLIKNYNELGGNLTEIAKRHDRTIRAIDMRITKLIKDKKQNQHLESDVAALFGGKMASQEFKDRWNSPSMEKDSATSRKKNNADNYSNEFCSLVLKYLTNMDEKIDELDRRVRKIEKIAIRLSKAMKIKKES